MSEDLELLAMQTTILSPRFSHTFLFSLVFALLACVFAAVPTAALTACDANIIDAEGDLEQIVDLSDSSELIANFLKSPFPNPKADIDDDGIVDLSDYGYVVHFLFQTCESNPNPGPITQSDEWVQFGHDAARTSFTAQTVA